MFAPLRRLTERLLRIPDPPDPPPGDESSTRLFRAAPNYYLYLLVTWLIRTVVVLVVLLPNEIIPVFGAVLEKFEYRLPFPTFRAPVFLLGLALIQRLFALALLRLDFEKRWYLVTDRSLRVREGVMRIREMTITFANIQNISISQGPIQRLLGLADLRVDTAGGAAQTSEKEGKENLHGVHFRGVNNAAEIRELINRRLRQMKDAGLGDTEELSTSAPIFPETAIALRSLAAPLREILAEVAALRESMAGQTMAPRP